jgi:hypothetical protein
MKYALKTPDGLTTDGSASRARVVALSGALIVVATLSGCSGRWFDLRPQGNSAQSQTQSENDQKASAVNYVRTLCALPREQRDPQVRELNEAILPNHATISCGRGGGGPPHE